MFGVGMSVPPWNPYSAQPTSSLRMIRTFGLPAATAPAGMARRLVKKHEATIEARARSQYIFERKARRSGEDLIMASGHSETLLKTSREILDEGALVGVGDGPLLERFTADRDELAELAFAALVHRHGPMVWRVCR